VRLLPKETSQNARVAIIGETKMLDWSDHWFWSLPKEWQEAFFSTPATTGWTCSDCGTEHLYHNGPPTSGGRYSAFHNYDAIWESDCCRTVLDDEVFGEFYNHSRY
jgi:hypothetical protein